jgi:hypothetical protein
MGAQWVQMRGFLPWLVRWTRCACTRDFCTALAALVRPQTSAKYFVPHHNIISGRSFLLIAQQACQAVVPGRLSLSCASLLWWWHWLSVLLVIILWMPANPNSTQWTVSVYYEEGLGSGVSSVHYPRQKTRPSFVLVLFMYSQLNDWDSGGSTVPIQRRNSWKYNFVGVLRFLSPWGFYLGFWPFYKKGIREQTWVYFIDCLFCKTMLFSKVNKEKQSQATTHFQLLLYKSLVQENHRGSEIRWWRWLKSMEQKSEKVFVPITSKNTPSVQYMHIGIENARQSRHLFYAHPPPEAQFLLL